MYERYELGRHLFAIVALTNGVLDKEAMNGLMDLVDSLAKEDRERADGDGFFQELSLWLGLKPDDSAHNRNYGHGIVESYPEYFIGRRKT